MSKSPLCAVWTAPNEHLDVAFEFAEDITPDLGYGYESYESLHLVTKRTFRAEGLPASRYTVGDTRDIVGNYTLPKVVLDSFPHRITNNFYPIDDIEAMLSREKSSATFLAVDDGEEEENLYPILAEREKDIVEVTKNIIETQIVTEYKNTNTINEIDKSISRNTGFGDIKSENISSVSSGEQLKANKPDATPNEIHNSEEIININNDSAQIINQSTNIDGDEIVNEYNLVSNESFSQDINLEQSNDILEQSIINFNEYTNQNNVVENNQQSIGSDKKNSYFSDESVDAELTTNNIYHNQTFNHDQQVNYVKSSNIFPVFNTINQIVELNNISPNDKYNNDNLSRNVLLNYFNGDSMTIIENGSDVNVIDGPDIQSSDGFIAELVLNSDTKESAQFTDVISEVYARDWDSVVGAIEIKELTIGESPVHVTLFGINNVADTGEQSESELNLENINQNNQIIVEQLDLINITSVTKDFDLPTQSKITQNVVAIETKIQEIIVDDSSQKEILSNNEKEADVKQLQELDSVDTIINTETFVDKPNDENVPLNVTKSEDGEISTVEIKHIKTDNEITTNVNIDEHFVVASKELDTPIIVEKLDDIQLGNIVLEQKSSNIYNIKTKDTLPFENNLTNVNNNLHQFKNIEFDLVLNVDTKNDEIIKEQILLTDIVQMNDRSVVYLEEISSINTLDEFFLTAHNDPPNAIDKELVIEKELDGEYSVITDSEQITNTNTQYIENALIEPQTNNNEVINNITSESILFAELQKTNPETEFVLVADLPSINETELLIVNLEGNSILQDEINSTTATTNIFSNNMIENNISTTHVPVYTSENSFKGNITGPLSDTIFIKNNKLNHVDDLAALIIAKRDNVFAEDKIMAKNIILNKNKTIINQSNPESINKKVINQKSSANIVTEIDEQILSNENVGYESEDNQKIDVIAENILNASNTESVIDISVRSDNIISDNKVEFVVKENDQNIDIIENIIEKDFPIEKDESIVNLPSEYNSSDEIISFDVTENIQNIENIIENNPNIENIIESVLTTEKNELPVDESVGIIPESKTIYETENKLVNTIIETNIEIGKYNSIEPQSIDAIVVDNDTDQPKKTEENYNKVDEIEVAANVVAALDSVSIVTDVQQEKYDLAKSAIDIVDNLEENINKKNYISSQIISVDSPLLSESQLDTNNTDGLVKSIVNDVVDTMDVLNNDRELDITEDGLLPKLNSQLDNQSLDRVDLLNTAVIDEIEIPDKIVGEFNKPLDYVAGIISEHEIIDNVAGIEFPHLENENVNQNKNIDTDVIPEGESHVLRTGQNTNIKQEAESNRDVEAIKLVNEPSLAKDQFMASTSDDLVTKESVGLYSNNKLDESPLHGAKHDTFEITEEKENASTNFVEIIIDAPLSDSEIIIDKQITEDNSNIISGIVDNSVQIHNEDLESSNNIEKPLISVIQQHIPGVEVFERSLENGSAVLFEHLSYKNSRINPLLVNNIEQSVETETPYAEVESIENDVIIEESHSDFISNTKHNFVEELLPEQEVEPIISTKTHFRDDGIERMTIAFDEQDNSQEQNILESNNMATLPQDTAYVHLDSGGVSDIISVEDIVDGNILIENNIVKLETEAIAKELDEVKLHKGQQIPRKVRRAISETDIMPQEGNISALKHSENIESNKYKFETFDSILEESAIDDIYYLNPLSPKQRDNNLDGNEDSGSDLNISNPIQTNVNLQEEQSVTNKSKTKEPIVDFNIPAIYGQLKGDLDSENMIIGESELEIPTEVKTNILHEEDINNKLNGNAREIKLEEGNFNQSSSDSLKHEQDHAVVQNNISNDNKESGFDRSSGDIPIRYAERIVNRIIQGMSQKIPTSNQAKSVSGKFDYGDISNQPIEKESGSTKFRFQPPKDDSGELHTILKYQQQLEELEKRFSEQFKEYEKETEARFEKRFEETWNKFIRG